MDLSHEGILGAWDSGFFLVVLVSLEVLVVLEFLDILDVLDVLDILGGAGLFRGLCFFVGRGW